MRTTDRLQVMPTYEELLAHLNAPDALTQQSKAQKVFYGIYLSAWFVVITIWAMIFLKADVSLNVAYLGLGAVVVASVCWIVDLAFSVLKHRDIFLNPARVLTRELDAEHSRERLLARQLAHFDNAVLTARLNRFESQLQVHERWMDITRLVGLLGPALFLTTKYMGWDDAVQNTLQWIGGAFFAGAIMGALLLRSGLRKMHRIAFVLRTASEMCSKNNTRRSVGANRVR